MKLSSMLLAIVMFVGMMLFLQALIDSMQEGVAGFISGYVLALLIIAIGAACAYAFHKMENEKPWYQRWLIGLFALVFFWAGLSLIGDLTRDILSGSRETIITTEYKVFHSSGRNAHYKIDLPSQNLRFNINYRSYLRIKRLNGEPLRIEYYPRSEVVWQWSVLPVPDEHATDKQ